jgi:hypothetical protein
MGIWLVVYFILEKGDLSNFDQPLFLDYISNANPTEFSSVLAQQAYRVNTLLLIANTCLPIAAFDGGRILADITITCGASVRDAAFINSSLSLIVGSGLITWGVFVLLPTDARNIIYGVTSLLFGFLCIKSGIDLWILAKNRRTMEDPLFSRQCYRSVTNEDSHNISNDNNIVDPDQQQP